ncbi:U1 small nuclear ribonucleoprotein [Operophtera brumata]|uniref:U1 small nuclear ribonucleoprotein 70 kDa n=1 Tax=Operophtera brumata TaxID=104452 RepID=A0A0L7LT78_OPEBR|nr:U1 small nuclear ribonucleoprotein [Operophtera brumata]
MTQFLPPNLLALFAARDPIPYLPPAAKLPHEKKQKGYDGVSAFLNVFEHPSDTPPPTRVETREERLERRRRERAEQTAYKLEQEIALWDPTANPSSTTDPFKTLFVARVVNTPPPTRVETREERLEKRRRERAEQTAYKLEQEIALWDPTANPSSTTDPREFEGYGPIKKIQMVFNKESDKPRGYAFIEYEHERDMHCEYIRGVAAYKHADGKKIDGKRVLVDVERARTVKGWLPRRLGELKIDGKRVLVDVERARTVKGWLPRRLGELKIDGKRVLVDVERARTVKGWLPRRLGELKIDGKRVLVDVERARTVKGWLPRRLVSGLM